MEKFFIKVMCIISIVAVVWVSFIFCKKTYLFIRAKKQTLKSSILDPDLGGILHKFMFILGIICINVFIHDFLDSSLYYDVYGIYFGNLLKYNIPIFCSLLIGIISEFFPVIVTEDCIYWLCEKVYKNDEVMYNYDEESIFLYRDKQELNIRRKKKHSLLINILDSNYKKQAE